MSLIRMSLLGLAVQFVVSACASAQSTHAAESEQPALMERQEEITRSRWRAANLTALRHKNSWP